MMMHEEENESEVLELIKKLMEELTNKMEYSADDFEERLGRKKPQVSVDVIAAKPMKSLSHDEAEEAEESLFPKEEAEEDKMGMGEDDMDCEDEDDEAGMLKKRLMRLGKG